MNVNINSRYFTIFHTGFYRNLPHFHILTPKLSTYTNLPFVNVSQCAQNGWGYFHGHKTITDGMIKNYQEKRLADGVSGSTINRELELAKAAFNRALRKDQAGVNPFAGFDKFTEVERSRYLTQEELKALLGALKKFGSTSPPTCMTSC